MDATQLSKLLPKRPENSHKGSFGKVLVIAGSKHYPGAAVLCSQAAYRVGAGLVTLFAEEYVCQIAASHLTELTYLFPSEGSIEEKLSVYQSIIIGPGLGQEPKNLELLKSIFSELSKLQNPPKVVIDADGLNILNTLGDIKKILSFDAILTPHPGEAANLLKVKTSEIQKDREAAVKKLTELTGQTIVLKGSNTIISLGKKKEILSFSNPLLATAGTGDVLSGMIAGFLAQGVNTFEAALLATYVHGLTGEQLKEKFGTSGALASSIIKLLPLTIKGVRDLAK